MGRLGKAWHPEDAEDAGLRARMVPLPMGAVVRGRDEDLGEIAVFEGILRVFLVWTSCALRVAAAHQMGVSGGGVWGYGKSSLRVFRMEGLANVCRRVEKHRVPRSLVDKPYGLGWSRKVGYGCDSGCR